MNKYSILKYALMIVLGGTIFITAVTNPEPEIVILFGGLYLIFLFFIRSPKAILLSFIPGLSFLLLLAYIFLLDEPSCGTGCSSGAFVVGALGYLFIGVPISVLSVIAATFFEVRARKQFKKLTA